MTPIYNSQNIPYIKIDKQEAIFMASLNAGRNDLVVGGGYINEEFNKAIAYILNSPPGNTVTTSEDLEINSKLLHNICRSQCYDKIKLTNSYKEGYFYEFESEILKRSNFFEKMYLYISEKELTISGLIGVGDIYIDILKRNPYNNSANKAMIYCAGPDGTKMNYVDISKLNINNEAPNSMVEKYFLFYVNTIGKNIANAIFKYNIWQKNLADRIDYVRICLISGGMFLPTFMNSDDIKIKAESQKKVANELMFGIHLANLDLSNREKHTFDQDIVYEFAYADGAFMNAYNSYKNKHLSDLNIF